MEKTQMSRVLGPATIALTIVASVALVSPPVHVKAFNPQPDPPAFGLIGVDPYATVRLNAVCADTPLPGGVSPGPCTVILAFRDINGAVISRTVRTISPGQGAAFDWNGAQIGSGRAEIQPSVPAVTGGFALLTVEVFDNQTGRTIATMTPAEPKSLSLTGR